MGWQYWFIIVLGILYIVDGILEALSHGKERSQKHYNAGVGFIYIIIGFAVLLAMGVLK
ncbi:MAG: hypothetical protein AABY15_09065 [Nanoarchaeota archaeon]